jgi:lysozyme
MRGQLLKQLRRDEGEVLHAYQDHLGFWTIGIGILIDKRKGGGLEPEESEFIFNNRVTKMQKALEASLPWLKDLDETRQGVLLNMCFNLGLNGLLGFKNTLAQIKAGNYEQASENMLLSKWASQVGDRAKRLAKQMRTGEWQ